MGLDTAPSNKVQISNFAKETINGVQHGIKKIVHTASHLLHESPSSSSSSAAAAAAAAAGSGSGGNSNVLDPRNESHENDGDLLYMHLTI